MQVAQADVIQNLELHLERWYGVEKLVGFLAGHFEHVGDVLSLVPDFESLAVIAAAFADDALDEDIRQEMHLNLGEAIAFAGLAAPAFDVERVAAGTVAPDLRFRQLREEIADQAEQAGIGRGVRARGFSDRALVDVD